MSVIKKRFKDEYLQRIAQLESEIFNAYYNFFAYTKISELNTKIIKDCKVVIVLKDLHYLLNSLTFSMKKDFVLILWKIFNDKDDRSNTLNNIIVKLKNKYLITNNNLDFHEFNLPEETYKELSAIRHKFIAHSDFNNNLLSIDLVNLKDQLDQSIKSYNSLLFDEAIKHKIDETVIERIHNSVNVGIQLLIDSPNVW